MVSPLPSLDSIIYFWYTGWHILFYYYCILLLLYDAYGCACHTTCGGQRSTFRSQFFPSTVGTSNKTQVSRLAQQAFLPAKPSHQPWWYILVAFVNHWEEQIHWKGGIAVLMLEQEQRGVICMKHGSVTVTFATRCTIHGCTQTNRYEQNS